MRCLVPSPSCTRGLSCAAAAVMSPEVQQTAATQPSGDATISVPGWLPVVLWTLRHSATYPRVWLPSHSRSWYRERCARVHSSVFKGMELQKGTCGAGLPAQQVALPTSRGCTAAVAKRFHPQHRSNYTAVHLIRTAGYLRFQALVWPQVIIKCKRQNEGPRVKPVLDGAGWVNAPMR